MVFIWGNKGYSNHIGFIIHECPECRQTVPFSVYQQKKKFTVYFIPTFSYSQKQLIECGSCKVAFEVPKDMKQTIQELLMSQEELSTLIAEANRKDRIEPSSASSDSTVTHNVEKKICPFCAEPIQAAAIFCRFCNHELSGDEESTLENAGALAKENSDDNLSGALFIIGINGMDLLENAIRPMMAESKELLPNNRAKAGFVIHSFALIWMAISYNVPVEDGKHLMEKQIDLLVNALQDMGFDWTREQTEAGIGRTWTTLVQAPGTDGDKLFQMGKIILSYFIGDDEIELTRNLEIVTVLTSIMATAKGAIEN